MGDRKGLTPEYVLYLWVGWSLQHQIIDGPACQGVLIWNDVCQVDMWVIVPATTYISLASVHFDTDARNVEGCGLIADALNPLTK